SDVRRATPSYTVARNTSSTFFRKSKSKLRSRATCSIESSKRSRRPRTPARSVTGKSSFSSLNKSCASGPARPVPMRSKGNPMKQFFALIASVGILIGAVGVSTTVAAQDKAADQKAGAPAASTPAPAAATPAPAVAAPAETKAEPPKADATAAPAAAPPAPTTPQVIAADKISSGDTAWMLTSTALVLLMTIPGLALFYGGMVRKKNVLATLMQSFAITCLVTVLWVIAGYSIAFTKGGPFFGSLDRLFLSGMLYQKEAAKLMVSHLALTIPESVYMAFQMT